MRPCDQRVPREEKQNHPAQVVVAMVIPVAGVGNRVTDRVADGNYDHGPEDVPDASPGSRPQRDARRHASTCSRTTAKTQQMANATTANPMKYSPATSQSVASSSAWHAASQ